MQRDHRRAEQDADLARPAHDARLPGYHPALKSNVGHRVALNSAAERTPRRQGDHQHSRTLQLHLRHGLWRGARIISARRSHRISHTPRHSLATGRLLHVLCHHAPFCHRLARLRTRIPVNSVQSKSRRSEMRLQGRVVCVDRGEAQPESVQRAEPQRQRGHLACAMPHPLNPDGARRCHSFSIPFTRS